MEETHRRSTISRREAIRTGAAISGAVMFGVSTTGSAAAKGKPDFSPRIWGDGEQWGTKVTGTIKHPNENSLDKFFIITNPFGELPDGTLPVSDAAPGNPDYNGGRWWTHVAEWTEAGFIAHGSPPPLLTRYGPADDPESIQFHENLGHIEITEGSPRGGPPDYFRCPLLPLKFDPSMVTAVNVADASEPTLRLDNYNQIPVEVKIHSTGASDGDMYMVPANHASYDPPEGKYVPAECGETITGLETRPHNGDTWYDSGFTGTTVIGGAGCP